MNLVGFSFSSLKEGRWYEYVIRFGLGGTATVFTGLVSSHYGAAIGGLFLALPAIFCASATLIEKHEQRRKREARLHGTRRGREAAAVVSAGAMLGSIGLLAFAAVFSLSVERSIVGAFAGGLAAWLIVSLVAWYVRTTIRRSRRRHAAGRRRGSTLARSRHG